jgi:hypothetical protein
METETLLTAGRKTIAGIQCQGNIKAPSDLESVAETRTILTYAGGKP